MHTDDVSGVAGAGICTYMTLASITLHDLEAVLVVLAIIALALFIFRR